jgi:hypothetical protein
LGVVDALLPQRLPDPLRDAAVALAMDQQRVHRPAAIVNRSIPDDLDEAGLRIDLHLAHCGSIGIRRDAHRLVADRHQRAAQIGRDIVAERASGDLEQANSAVGPLYNEAPEREFDILLGGFEHGASDAAPPVDDGVRGFGDDPGAKTHRPRRGRAAACLHAVGITGH